MTVSRNIQWRHTSEGWAKQGGIIYIAVYVVLAARTTQITINPLPILFIFSCVFFFQQDIPIWLLIPKRSVSKFCWGVRVICRGPEHAARLLSPWQLPPSGQVSLSTPSCKFSIAPVFSEAVNKHWCWEMALEQVDKTNNKKGFRWVKPDTCQE